MSEDRERELAELLQEVRALRRELNELKGGARLPPDYAVLARTRPTLPPDYAVAVRVGRRPPDYAVLVRPGLFEPPSYEVLVRPAIPEIDEDPLADG